MLSDATLLSFLRPRRDRSLRCLSFFVSFFSFFDFFFFGSEPDDDDSDELPRRDDDDDDDSELELELELDLCLLPRPFDLPLLGSCRPFTIACNSLCRRRSRSISLWPPLAFCAPFVSSGLLLALRLRDFFASRGDLLCSGTPRCTGLGDLSGDLVLDPGRNGPSRDPRSPTLRAVLGGPRIQIRPKTPITCGLRLARSVKIC